MSDESTALADMLLDAEAELAEQRTLSALEGKLDELIADVAEVQKSIKALKVGDAKGKRIVRLTVTERDAQERISEAEITIK